MDQILEYVYMCNAFILNIYYNKIKIKKSLKKIICIVSINLHHIIHLCGEVYLKLVNKFNVNCFNINLNIYNIDVTISSK